LATIDIADLSIVLVEPSSTQLRVILRSLAEAGAGNVEGLATGGEALAVMEQFPPDLVISAMYLPDMSATDLVRAMRQHDTLHEVPFMLISSETQFHALDPIRQAGVVAILPKPFGQEELQRALRSTIELLDPQELSLDHIDLDDLRVMVVDDSATARKHIQRVLENLGISRITAAQNGREAAELCANGDFDLIVTDLNMPEMDGLQLVEYIRRQLGDNSIPILMVTSEQDSTRLANVEQAGVSAICDKPFEPQNIKDILARVLQDG
jgi:two-component system chemotaxis response regulator CheY